MVVFIVDINCHKLIPNDIINTFLLQFGCFYRLSKLNNNNILIKIRRKNNHLWCSQNVLNDPHPLTNYHTIQANKLSINFAGIPYLGVLFDPPPKLIDTSTLCFLPFILSQSFLQVNALNP